MSSLSAKLADERRDRVEPFLRAYRHASRDVYDAFTALDGSQRLGPAASEILTILATYLPLGVPEIKLTISAVDPDARLDVKDVLRQAAWYRAQGLVKGDFDAASIIDQRYVIPLPPQ